MPVQESRVSHAIMIRRITTLQVVNFCLCSIFALESFCVTTADMACLSLDEENGTL